jgi:hypothetical protein
MNIFLQISILLLKNLYLNISMISTTRENHKTNQAFNDSLNYKRFYFSIINRYLLSKYFRFAHIFYIAFAELDL